MKILGIIPARYASTRFPGKPLALIGGVPMIQRVYAQALKAPALHRVIVATDNQEILDCVRTFGGTACLTAETHASGTDRCYEVFSQQTEPYDYVINIQGDEPFINPEQIELLAALLDGETELATLVKKITDQQQLINPNVVKAVLNNKSEALYFSRSPIPFWRGPETNWTQHHLYYKHIGLYAYRADVLQQITRLQVSALEKAESLEQLRWLENGFKIKTAETQLETLGIDTPEDLERANAEAATA
ncbi:MAG: 3-deoxy-manno-octulosonate cytidylyltransferase [Cyclobacteriaceae bacterium]|nr:3-deoxy-manno-octulosonate cytidylyltransferase [Cyclobacteriaceae bacterium]